MNLIVPVLLLGGIVGAELSKSLRKRKNLVKKFKHNKVKVVNPTSLAQRVDLHYQKFFQTKIDPLLISKRRSQQMQEFASEYNDKEIDINRRLGMAIFNSKLAILGYFIYPPLSLISVINLVFIMWPISKQAIKILIREKRLQYRLVAFLSVWCSVLAGYYVVSSLAIMVFFSTLKIAARTEAYSRAALINVFNLDSPNMVWVQQSEGIETQIAFADLRIGDIIVLSAGQIIPIDGLIKEGMATIDQQALTGESQPAEKSAGDMVLANTLIMNGKLYVKVEKTGNDTAVAQIAKLIGNMGAHTSEHETNIANSVDKLTLPVLAASGMALVTVGPAGAAAIMNNGFDSIMIISGSISILTHLDIASHYGILVKDGRALSKLCQVDTIVFDKTGTLTLEQPELSHIYCCPAWQESQVLQFAALAEYRQTHPVAKAILTAAQQHGLVLTAPDDAMYKIGFGIEVKHQGNIIQVGSLRFMQQAKINIPSIMAEIITTCQAKGNSLIFVAINGKMAGALELQAQLRPDAANIVAKLQQRGLKICIISGDQRQPTEYLAQKLGIDDVFAEVLPEGKADIIRQLQESGHNVCFVGDGINDAIALQQANVSVSLRGATSIATDTAQIVLMSQSLQQLDKLIEIAQELNKNLIQTMKMAYIPGTILIGGVFTLHLGMKAALLLYSGGVIVGIKKALTPLRKLP
jgi:heavy metal translocating P-type ATPase